MDSFAEPHKPLDNSISLEDVRAQVSKLEADLHDKNVPLSGRIIHVCHYLPITCAFARRPRPSDIPSPPATPPAKASDIPPSPTAEQAQEASSSGETIPAPRGTAPQQQPSQWQLHVRYGHSALVSGIDSLATTHEQIYVGWTGDIEAGSGSGAQVAGEQDASGSEPAPGKVPSASLAEEDKKELEGLLADYHVRDELKDGKPIHYVPVWLDDKEAHGHYDGYCKQSESAFVFPACCMLCFSAVRRSLACPIRSGWLRNECGFPNRYRLGFWTEIALRCYFGPGTEASRA